MALQCYDRSPSLRSTPLHTEAAGAAPFDTFGPFRVLHQIGAGTLGPVFRAYDPEQDRLVAVKLFQLDLTPERVHQLVEGLQRLIDADLAHPALSAPLATGLAGASAFLAQDFVAADSLDVVLRESGPMTFADAARVAAQLAGALDFAAAAGVFHGALHPRDVLLGSDDARLTGLGVTQVLDRLGAPSAMRRPYTAPERLAGQPWDRRADVFSLAVLIAELLTGRRPTATGMEAAEGIAHAAGGDTGALRAVFATALADSPDDRFATAQAFADAFKTVADRSGRVAPADAPTLPPPAERRLEPRLPRAEPITRAIETPLPGDVPLARDGDGALEVPLASNVSAAPGVDPAIVRAATHGDGITADWELRAAPEEPAHVPLPLLDLPQLVTPEPHAAPVAHATPATREAAAPVPATMPPPPADKTSRPAAPAARMESGRDATHSAVWPLALALTVGLIVGIALGFFIFADHGQADSAAVAVAPDDSTVVSDAPQGAPPAGPPAVPVPVPDVVGLPPAVTPTVRAPQSAPPESAPPPTAAMPPAPPSAPPRDAPSAAERRQAAAGTAPRRTAAIGGRLLVRTSPAGARVVLDGQDVGVTPLTLRSLPFGTHTLRVTREGYESESRRVIISTAQPAQSLIVDLVRVRGGTAAAGGGDPRFTASLAVESRPPGASVYLDGRRVGITPLVLDAAPTGSHALRLELDGYRRWTSSVRVSVGERNRVTASLEQ